MATEMSKTRKLLFYAALLLTNVIICTDYVIYPISYALYEAFPGSEAGINFIISGPAMIIIFASLLVPVILKFMSKKTLLVIGSAAFAITSIGGCLIESVPYMIACRSVGGFCYAIANVCAMGIIADHFVDETKRGAFMGIFNAAMTAIGAVMGVVAGNLAVSGWQNAYKTYWIAIPMLVMVLLFIPKIEAPAQQGEGAAEDAAAPAATKGIGGLGRRFWMMLVGFCLVSVAYNNSVLYYMSVYIMENGLGNEALSGTVSSVASIAAAVTCLAFGAVYGKLKARTSVPFFAGITVSTLLLAFVPSVATVFIAAIVGGGSFGVLFSYVYAEGSSCVPADRIDQALAIVTSACGVAMFVCTYLETGIMGAMGTSMVTPTLPVLGVIAVVATVLEVLSTARVRR